MRSLHTPATEIVIIAAPRTGTNFFCECLGDLGEFVGLFEIFNRRGVMGSDSKGLLERLGNELGVHDPEGATDQRLVDAVRERPFVALEALGEAARDRGRQGFSYKIFPKQLDRDDLAALVAGPSRHLLFLVRRRLDVFISYEKARQSDVWKNKSTTDLETEISVDDFLAWGATTDQWYADTRHLARLHHKHYEVVDYDRDINVPKPELMQSIAEMLARFDVDVTVPEDARSARFKKQDRSDEPFEKIANGEQVRAELESRGQLDYALSSPLLDESAASVNASS